MASRNFSDIAILSTLARAFIFGFKNLSRNATFFSLEIFEKLPLNTLVLTTPVSTTPVFNTLAFLDTHASVAALLEGRPWPDSLDLGFSSSFPIAIR